MSDDLRHGGALDIMRAAFPQAPQPWIDLSTGVNPWPYPKTHVTPDALARLPTRAALDACREAMADAIGAQPDRLLLAPGSEFLIRLLPSVIRLRTVAVLWPSYSDHDEVWRNAGADVQPTADPLACADSADALVICNPNNPDGAAFDPDELDRVRKILAARGGWLIVDEAYADLDPLLSLASMGGEDGLIVFRSFGKFYGLAGVRLGAVIAPKPVRRALAKRLGSWAVSGAALEIGARAYGDRVWQDQTRVKLEKACKRLDAILADRGLNPVGGTTLYRYVETEHAHTLWRRLAARGVYVRRFDWSTHHLRIGLPRGAEAEVRLKTALEP